MYVHVYIYIYIHAHVCAYRGDGHAVDSHRREIASSWFVVCQRDERRVVCSFFCLFAWHCSGRACPCFTPWTACPCGRSAGGITGFVFTGPNQSPFATESALNSRVARWSTFVQKVRACVPLGVCVCVCVCVCGWVGEWCVCVCLFRLVWLKIDGFHWFRWDLFHLPGPSIFNQKASYVGVVQLIRQRSPRLPGRTSWRTSWGARIRCISAPRQCSCGPTS